jgi:outer membrane lipoprotein-sorting protein
MTKILRFGLTAAALALFLGAFAVSDAKAQQINEILKRMESYRVNLTSLESNLTMLKYDPVIKKTDTTQGALKYAAVRDKKGKDVNAAIRIDWVRPEETLSVANGKYILYYRQSRFEKRERQRRRRSEIYEYVEKGTDRQLQRGLSRRSQTRRRNGGSASETYAENRF